MGRRSRSRSPYRGDRVERVERRRSRSRDRDRKRRRHRSRTPPGAGGSKSRRRSRSYSPSRRRSRSPPGHAKRSAYDGADVGASSTSSRARQPQFLPRPEIAQSELEGKSEEEVQMMRLMGFGNFDSTKGKKVAGNDQNHASNLVHKRKYRQYMNRRGGFNRPLDFIA